MKNIFSLESTETGLLPLNFITIVFFFLLDCKKKILQKKSYSPQNAALNLSSS